MDTTSIASAASVPGGQNSSSTPPSPFSKACVTIRGIVYRPRRIYTKGNMTMKVRKEEGCYCFYFESENVKGRSNGVLIGWMVG